MKKKRIVTEIKEKWDKKSTLNLVLLILAIIPFIIIFTVMPVYLRNYKLGKYEGNVSGWVLSIKANYTEYQSFRGSITMKPFYIVAFVYKVNGKEYRNSNNIPNKGKYKKFILGIYESNYKKKISIKYSLNNPQNSLILIE
jgi:hypothetical protein